MRRTRQAHQVWHMDQDKCTLQWKGGAQGWHQLLVQVLLGDKWNAQFSGTIRDVIVLGLSTLHDDRKCSSMRPYCVGDKLSRLGTVLRTHTRYVQPL